MSLSISSTTSIGWDGSGWDGGKVIGGGTVGGGSVTGGGVRAKSQLCSLQLLAAPKEIRKVEKLIS